MYSLREELKSKVQSAGDDEVVGELSEWERSRLGVDAERIRYEICLAIRDAQVEATRAQVAQSSNAHDTYGHTLYVAQHEMLIQRLRAIPGVVLRKPAGVRSRFEFAVVEETNAVIVPIRFSRDPRTRHDHARLPPLSELRSTLLDLRPVAPEYQLPFDDAAVGPEQAERQYEEELMAFEELQELGNAVVVGFGSTPDGVFELGLGCVHVVDQARGVVEWHPWVPLPILDADGDVPAAPPLRAVPALERRVDRFDSDEVADDDELGLRARIRPLEAPSSEIGDDVDEQATGSDYSEGE